MKRLGLGKLASALWSIMAITAMLVSATLTVSAQSANSYTTGTGSHQVNWSADWEMSPDESSSDSGFDAILLQKDTSLVQVMFFPSGVNLVGMRDIFTSNFKKGFGGQVEALDSGNYGNVAYEFDRLMLDGIEMGMFLVMIDRGPGSDSTGLLFAAPASVFATQFEQAQMEITVDSDSVFEGVDGAGLQALLGSSSPSPLTTGRKPSSSSSTTSKTTSSRGSASHTVPGWGYTVNYAGSWSDSSGIADVGDFSVYLASPVTIVGFTGVATGGVPEVLFFDAASQVFRDGLPAGSNLIGQIVGQDRILLAAQTPDGVFVQEILYLGDGSMAVIVTMMSQGSASSAVSAAQSGLTVNGVSLFAQWTLIGN